MPALNVITWNSTGETQQGAADLQNVINHVVANNWQPHVILIQEANAVPGAPNAHIYAMLNALGPNYNLPPVHVQEGNGFGRAYLLVTHTSVNGQGTFARVDLSADVGLQAWIGASLHFQMQTTAAQQLATMRMPASATLTVANTAVNLLTWHAPRGIGNILQAHTLQGGADPDAYLFLENSDAYQNLTTLPAGGLALIAGDLNVSFGQINGLTGIPLMPRVLQGWQGLTDNLDHILARLPGGVNPGFAHGGNFNATGTHRILVGTVNW